MTDLDQLLEKAGADAQKSVRTISTPSAVTIQRRARRHRITAAAAGVALIGGIGVSAMLLSSESAGPVASDPDVLITTEMILEDGVVTEEEYRAGAEAVVACLADVGVEGWVEYDEGGNVILGYSGGGPLGETGLSVMERCSETHFGQKVGYLRRVQRGEADPERRVVYETAIFDCVEARTGRDFGEVSFDSDGFPTPEGEQALERALFAEEDHESWVECLHEIDVESWLETGPYDDDPEPGSGLEVVQRGGLTLTLSGALDNPCVEVRSATGMAGGCGADFSQLLQFGVGGVDGISFVNGWAPQNSAKVVVTLGDGTEIEVTDLVAVEGFDVLFFLELLPPTVSGEPELPITATAFDQTGGITAEFVLSEPDAP